MKSKEQQLKEITDFISSQKENIGFELEEHHSLQEDLDIEGNEMIEFLLSFGKKFKVDISEFDLNQYLQPEGVCSRISCQKITIGDLLETLDTGFLV